MLRRDLIFSAILLSAGASCINAFLSPPSQHPHLQLAANRHETPNFNPLPAQMNDNDDQEGFSAAAAEESDNFDAAGFGNYLAPY
mmetsp:Transcript_24565/g.35164  ORF Transcript_24565/g.35164 Transcript_24565/m.35164 type:complete len:85 (+) Transcript_24565:89-343(+)